MDLTVPELYPSARFGKLRQIQGRPNIVDLRTRYPVRSRFDAAENRLTAAVAAALVIADTTLIERLAEELWSKVGDLRIKPGSRTLEALDGRVAEADLPPKLG